MPSATRREVQREVQGSHVAHGGLVSPCLVRRGERHDVSAASLSVASGPIPRAAQARSRTPSYSGTTCCGYSATAGRERLARCDRS